MGAETKCLKNVRSVWHEIVINDSSRIVDFNQVEKSKKRENSIGNF